MRPVRSRGKPLAFVFFGGEHHARYVEALLQRAYVRRRRHIRAVPPRRSDPRPNDRRHAPLDCALYQQRNRVERSVGRLKQSRRIATRFGKHAAHYAATLSLAATLIWLSRQEWYA